MRKKSIILVMLIVSVLLTGCVDFEKIVQEQEAEKANIDISLGDINNDGKEERLVLAENNLELYSGSRICEKFELSDEHEYSAVKARVSDVDGDGENEIIAMLNCGNRNEHYVYNVFIITQSDAAAYELLDFPSEITSNYAESGFSAEVSVNEEFIYTVKKGEYQFDVDVTQLYGIGLLEKSQLEQVESQWEKISKAVYQGQVLGICDIKILTDSNGNNNMYVYEYVVGGDDKIIGNIVICCTYNAEGKCIINEVLFETDNDKHVDITTE